MLADKCSIRRMRAIQAELHKPRMVKKTKRKRRKRRKRRSYLLSNRMLDSMQE